jgi:hypothetical protein
MLSRESSASKRYGHREDCTLLFDLHPLFVVEQVHEDARGTVYLVGDREGSFTLDYKPALSELQIKHLLNKLKQERLEKIQEACPRDPVQTTGLEHL